MALRAGGFAAIVVVAMTVFGVSLLFAIFSWLYGVGSEGGLSAHEIPLMLVGYGFGASFVALFAQLGGGIYTKAADVGADLVRKVEAGSIRRMTRETRRWSRISSGITSGIAPRAARISSSPSPRR